MGTVTSDDYASVSRAALSGGTTCFIDFVNPGRDENPLDAIARWDERSAGCSACDFSYHIAISRWDDVVERQLREIVSAGITSFKIYLAYKGTLALTDTELFRALELAAELNVLTAVHCENAALVDILQQRLLAEGKCGPEWHYWSRPPIVETLGVQHATTFAELAGASIYIVHTSCADSLRVAMDAKLRGVNVSVETCIQYLLLDKQYAEGPGFNAAKYILSPPLREKGNQDALWAAVRDGFINTVATDHAPTNFGTQKSAGRDDFTKITNGLPGVEDRVNLLYTYGVLKDRISLERLVDIASTQPARLFGLYPRKGAIAVGSDADLVVYDPEYDGIISAETQMTNVDYNPYEGWSISGRPDVVTVRGEIVVENGAFVGDPVRGRFLKREKCE
jgi:dihydropyrimidinase